LTQGQVALGVIVAPRFERESAEIAAELGEDLRKHYGSVVWQIDLAVDSLVTPPATATEIFESARAKLLERNWDLAIVVTDLPVRIGGRPVALFALILLGASIVIDPSVFDRAVGREVRLADYLRLAWFVASLATVGGALGAALESDEAVREAAYTYEPGN
jgi:hypothetical protein